MLLVLNLILFSGRPPVPQETVSVSEVAALSHPPPTTRPGAWPGTWQMSGESLGSVSEWRLSGVRKETSSCRGGRKARGPREGGVKLGREGCGERGENRVRAQPRPRGEGGTGRKGAGHRAAALFLTSIFYA